MTTRPTPPSIEDISGYLRDLGRLPMLDEQHLPGVLAKARMGDLAARERLVLAHLKLVVRVALKYVGYGVPLADLISEGNLGLVRAVELYDAKHGTTLGSYATLWVRHRIFRAISSQGKVVRVPVWRSQRLRCLNRLQAQLEASADAETPLHEVADQVGINPADLARIVEDKIVVQSLDATQGETSPGMPVLDEADLPAERICRRELREEVLASLDDLDDAELHVLAAKFGLVESEPESYREMAVRLGRSREWVRRVGDRALGKMRESMRMVASFPRKLVEERRRKVAERLVYLKKTGASVSLHNTVLFHWLEALLPAL